MSYSSIETNKRNTHGDPIYEFVMDSQSDLENLPAYATAGSKAKLADNSKEWMKAPSGTWTQINSGGGSGESNVFVVTFTSNSSTQTTTCDKTFSEINAALSSNKIIIGKIKDINSVYNDQTANIFIYEDGDDYFVFQFASMSGEIGGRHVSIGESGSIYDARWD